MDFFAAQSASLARSRLLTGLFATAVVAIIVTLYAVARVAMAGPAGAFADPFDASLLGWVATVTGLLIGGGSWYRIRKLSAGGPAVAALMGGRSVLPNTMDPDERRLLNVVAEMALASGTRLPAVFVLDTEDGMNAFAAGYTIHDAAIAVTRGTLRGLTRDELQGVVAHEFSHILNGDMRLNIRLIGLLHGILMLAMIGRGLLRGSGRRSRSAASASLAGAVLLIVGYVGVFFGKLIRAAVSREREFLADAAAVQFTRNPQAIAGALKKIGTGSSRVATHVAEEFSHLFFAHGLRTHWFGFLATHPPLDARIRRIEPEWDGWLVPQVPQVSSGGTGVVAGLAPAESVGAALFSSIGSPTAEHLEYAEEMMRRIPAPVLEAVQTPEGSKFVVLAVLLASATAAGGAHRVGVLEAAGPKCAEHVLNLTFTIRELGPEARVPLLDLALPALQMLPLADARAFRVAVLRAIRADGSIHMFEYTLAHVLSRRLAPARDGQVPGRTIHSFNPLRHDTAVVLSALSRAGGSEESARAAFRVAVERLPASVGEIHLRDDGDVTLPAVDEALARIANSSIGLRRRFLDACAHCVAHDRTLRTTEVELLRAIAEALDCPMPPFIPPLVHGPGVPSTVPPAARLEH